VRGSLITYLREFGDILGRCREQSGEYHVHILRYPVRQTNGAEVVMNEVCSCLQPPLLPPVPLLQPHAGGLVVQHRVQGVGAEPLAGVPGVDPCPACWTQPLVFPGELSGPSNSQQIRVP
jgi:hypothetical protein